MRYSIVYCMRREGAAQCYPTLQYSNLQALLRSTSSVKLFAFTCTIYAVLWADFYRGAGDNMKCEPENFINSACRCQDTAQWFIPLRGLLFVIILVSNSRTLTRLRGKCCSSFYRLSPCSHIWIAKAACCPGWHCPALWQNLSQNKLCC